MRDEEHRLQSTCVKWFRLKYRNYADLLVAVPNGGRRDAVTGARLKAEGVVAGVSDLVLFVANGQFHGLCIEMKTGSGRQSKAQQEWQRAVEAQGYMYEVCRSFDCFKSLIETYLNNIIIHF